MQMDPDKPPAFCKILPSTETFMNKMQMPSYFIKENKNMLTKACLLKRNEAGMSWEAKIVREKPNYFICEGDWPQLVVHHQLKHGDILLFFLIEKTTFRVQSYTKKCCENNITRERQLFNEELSSSSEEENIGPSKRARKMKSKIVAPDTEEESVDMSSSDESKHEYDPPYTHHATYYNNPRRDKVSSDGEDDEDDSESEKYGPKKRILVNFSGDDPYYEIIVKKSHMTFMTIPIRFAKKTGIISMKKIRLVNEKGTEECEVEIVHVGSRVNIKGGWAEFRINNQIASGDTCRFKLIQGHAAINVLQVQKISTPRFL